MTTQHGEFEITITQEDMANAPLFQYSYGDTDNAYYSKSYGIRVKQNDVEVSSAMLSGGTIALSIFDTSFVIKNESLYICYGNEVYALTLPGLQLQWQKQLDFATCFGIYKYEDDLIVHGEIDITRISTDGVIRWQFSGADIFVNLDGKLTFNIVDQEIKLTDFNGMEYTLNGDGEVIG